MNARNFLRTSPMFDSIEIVREPMDPETRKKLDALTLYRNASGQYVRAGQLPSRHWAVFDDASGEVMQRLFSEREFADTFTPYKCPKCGTNGSHACPADVDTGETDPDAVTLEEHLRECDFCRESALCREGARLATRERLEREADANFQHYADSEEI